MRPLASFRRLPAAWFLAALFVLGNAVLGLPGPPGLGPVPAVLGLGCLGGALLLLLLDARPRCSAPRTLAVLALVLAMILVVSAPLPLDPPMGYATWHLGAVTMVLIGLTVRGRVGAAWIGMALMLVMTMLWAWRDGAGAGVALALSVTHVGLLAAASVVAIVLGLLGARTDRVREAARRREVAASAATEADRAELRVAEDVLARVVPVLGTIAASGPLGAEQRREARVLEATLRDGIRVPDVARCPALADAAEEARRAGREVLLLDDTPESAAAAEARVSLAERLAPVLRATADDRITVRFSGRAGAFRMTLVSASQDVTLHHD